MSKSDELFDSKPPENLPVVVEDDEERRNLGAGGKKKKKGAEKKKKQKEKKEKEKKPEKKELEKLEKENAKLKQLKEKLQAGLNDLTGKDVDMAFLNEIAIIRDSSLARANALEEQWKKGKLTPSFEAMMIPEFLNKPHLYEWLEDKPNYRFGYQETLENLFVGAMYGKQLNQEEVKKNVRLLFAQCAHPDDKGERLFRTMYLFVDDIVLSTHSYFDFVYGCKSDLEVSAWEYTQDNFDLVRGHMQVYFNGYVDWPNQTGKVVVAPHQGGRDNFFDPPSQVPNNSNQRRRASEGEFLFLRAILLFSAILVGLAIAIKLVKRIYGWIQDNSQVK